MLRVKRAGRMARQDDDEFNSQIVRQHNIYRKQHGNVRSCFLQLYLLTL